MTAYSPRRSQVFIVRTWTEEHGEHLLEIRGMVRDLHSGETRYFRTWNELLNFLASHANEADHKVAAHQEAAHGYTPPFGIEAEKAVDLQEELPGDALYGNPDFTPDGRD